MLKNEQKIESYIKFCQARGVSQRGLEIVKEIITNPPYRRVNTRSMSPNLTCRFPSRKMGFTIQAESRSMELSSIYLKESDSSVIGYWDQPAHRPSLSYKSGSRNVRVSVTLDFFVISDEFIGFEECKPLETLRKLCLKKPERFCFDEGSDEYKIPPLDAYLQGTGLGHRVISDQQIDKTYVENLAFLYDLLDESVTSEDRQRWVAAKKLVDAKGGLTIKQIEQSIIGLSRISLLTAIAHRELYVDFYMQHLKEPERVFVYANANVAKSENLALEKIDVAPELMVGSAQEVTEALERFKTIEPLIDGADIKIVSESQGISVRTLQRWLKSYRDDDLQGLQPKHGSKGNAVSRLPKPVENFITEVIESYYLDNQARKPFHVYQLLKSKCQEIGLQPPSLQAFYDRFKLLSDSSVLKVREGAKRAYQATGYEGLENGNDGHSFVSVSRFLERCHIDHTQVDIQLVSADGANLGKPWLTLIIDEMSGFILAVYLSFRNPGVPALMSAIRLMVKQHGVIPEAVVVDGGKEFESIYFETLMARHRCMIISRKGKPRAGGPVERIFGTIN
jgi:putative transposase